MLAVGAAAAVSAASLASSCTFFSTALRACDDLRPRQLLGLFGRHDDVALASVRACSRRWRRTTAQLSLSFLQAQELSICLLVFEGVGEGRVGLSGQGDRPVHRVIAAGCCEGQRLGARAEGLAHLIGVLATARRVGEREE